MLRRDFIKNIVAGSTCLVGSTLTLNSAMAANNAPDRYWVFVQARGGWDVTNMWDPKGKEVQTSRGDMNHYSKDDIRKKGNIKYAPVPPNVDTEDYLHTFTQKHYNRMLVMNGVDIGNNSHKVGGRICMQGSDSPISPTTAAMIASPFASSQPMAFITSGTTYTETTGLVAPSKLIAANRYKDLLNKDKYLGNSTVDKLNKLRMDKINKRQLLGLSQKTSDTLNQLKNARLSASELSTFVDRLPENPSSGHQGNAEIIAAAFSAGIASSAQIGVGSFDSHSDNDQQQWSKMDELLLTVDTLWQQLEMQGISDRTTIMIVSDMGRTPGYNKNNGKDHWPITSMVLMGYGVEGNTVVGKTDNNLVGLKVDPVTLQQDDNGISLTAAEVHNAVRNVSGIKNTLLNDKFPLFASEINLIS